jgi:hypothetical protein
LGIFYYFICGVGKFFEKFRIAELGISAPYEYENVARRLEMRGAFAEYRAKSSPRGIAFHGATDFFARYKAEPRLRVFRTRQAIKNEGGTIRLP